MPVSSGYILVHLHKSATQKKDTAKSAVVDFDRTLPSAQGGANYMVHTTFNTGGAIRAQTLQHQKKAIAKSAVVDFRRAL